jgi:hypothetical protein
MRRVCSCSRQLDCWVGVRVLTRKKSRYDVQEMARWTMGASDALDGSCVSAGSALHSARLMPNADAMTVVVHSIAKNRLKRRNDYCESSATGRVTSDDVEISSRWRHSVTWIFESNSQFRTGFEISRAEQHKARNLVTFCGRSKRRTEMQKQILRLPPPNLPQELNRSLGPLVRSGPRSLRMTPLNLRLIDGSGLCESASWELLICSFSLIGRCRRSAQLPPAEGSQRDRQSPG